MKKVDTKSVLKIQTYLAPQNDCLNPIFVKVVHEVGKKWPEIVVKRPFNTLLRFLKKEAVATRQGSSQLLFWSLFEWLILTKCHSHYQYNHKS